MHNKIIHLKSHFDTIKSKITVAHAHTPMIYFLETLGFKNLIEYHPILDQAMRIVQ